MRIGANQKRILKLLAKHGKLYGYKIIKEFAKERGITSTQEMLRLSGIVYPAMQGLVEKGLVKAVEEGGRIYYVVTKSGLRLLSKLEEKGERIEIGKNILFLVLDENVDMVAFNYCLKMAKTIGSRIYGVYIPDILLDRVTVSSKLLMEDEAYKELTKHLAARGKSALEDLERIASQHKVPFKGLIEYGEIEKIILKLVRRYKTEVIVLSGSSLIMRKRAKTIISKLVSASPCPILIIPKRYKG